MIFAGKAPTNLGISGGRFTAAQTWKPNWVSSQVVSSDKHYVAPLSFSGDAMAAVKKLKSVIQGMERTKIIEEKPDYFYAQFSTKLMGYVDDVEFFCDGKAIHVRSSSRLGIRDFDVNRKRMEAIRKTFSS